jgi:acetate kinase
VSGQKIKMKKILVLNCGSSSVKYSLFEDDNLLMKGLIEKIGEKNSKIKNHDSAINLMIKQILKSKKIISISEINAVGHRVVHGGEISKSCIINKKIINLIKNYSPLAPLHNPLNLKGILSMKKILPDVPNVAVFDTSFHQTMPEKSFIYPLPYEFYKKYKIRRYGFHGTSHHYIALESSKILKKNLKKLNLITCHLGAGCSITAIEKGKVIDTSMGMTPLEGLMMTTRSGDIDAGIIFYLYDNLKMSSKEINDLLNKKSGLIGVSGMGKDMRIILRGNKNNDRRCRLALEIFCYRLKKYISSYAGILGKVDAIIFTAGIGENVPLIRKLTTDIEFLNIKIDKNKNSKNEKIITSANSKIQVLVIPTDEEKMIAIETSKFLK